MQWPLACGDVLSVQLSQRANTIHATIAQAPERTVRSIAVYGTTPLNELVQQHGVHYQFLARYPSDNTCYGWLQPYDRRTGALSGIVYDASLTVTDD